MRNTKSMLAVHNDRHLLQSIDELLSQKGHRVVVADIGLAALDVLKTYSPDTLYIDHTMPNMDSQELCSLIRSMLKLSHA